MKTTVTIPDHLVAAADWLAKHLGMTKSELFTRAVAEFVAKHTEADVTARLNAVYGRAPSGLEPALRSAELRSIRDTEW